jgi:hypothetical protein
VYTVFAYIHLPTTFLTSVPTPSGHIPPSCSLILWKKGRKIIFLLI